MARPHETLHRTGDIGPGGAADGEGSWRTQRVGGLTVLPGLIRGFGADPDDVLAGAGLAPDALADASGRIAFPALPRLLNEAVARTGCPHLGLLVGRSWHLSDHGLLGEIARNAPTLGAALRQIVVFQYANSGGGVLYLLPYDGVVDFGYAIYDPQVRGTSHLYDTALAVMMNAIRELCGEDVNPSEVFLPHGAPADVIPYRRYLRAPLRFDAEFCALRLPESVLARPIEGADPVRMRDAEMQLLRNGKGDFVQAVYRTLRTLLLLGKTSGGHVARALALHRRTLNRRLQAKGTTFQHVLDDVRYTDARELLADSSVSIHDIAATLGYAGLPPFFRAFRRWSGTSPANWRNAIRERPAGG